MAEQWLKPERMPRHVAIIMDGNGRWAEKRGLPRAMGHRAGVEAMRRNHPGKQRSRDRSAFALRVFDDENWKRSTEEVGVLMGLLLELSATAKWKTFTATTCASASSAMWSICLIHSAKR